MTLNFPFSRRRKRASLLFGSPETGNECFFFLFSHGPIVVDLNGNFTRDFDGRVLLIELIEVLLVLKDRLLWRLLALSVFIFFLRSVFLFGLFLLSCFMGFVSLEIGSMVSLELFFGVFDHFLAVLSSLFRLSNQTFTVLTCLLTHGLASSDVCFTGINGKLKPLENLSESWAVAVYYLLISTFNNSLAVGDSLVLFEIAFVLSEYFIVFHAHCQRWVNYKLSFFPAELLGVRLANHVFREFEQVHNRLDDLRHLYNFAFLELAKFLLPVLVIDEGFTHLGQPHLFGSHFFFLLITVKLFSSFGKVFFDLLLHLF